MFHQTGKIMLKKFAHKFATCSLLFLLSEGLLIYPSVAQSVRQDSNQNSNIGDDSDFNNVIQNQNQNNAQNRTEVNFPNIFPLDNPINTPVNTENDFGLNLSVGVNTLDSSNVTVYMGIIFQPGRTEDHKNRMSRLRAETAALESQREVSQAQLQLLQKQIAEAELRLQRMQQSPESGAPNNLPDR
jgi:hypothetical protein